MSDGGWCTIESDPGVFAALIEESLQVPHIGVEEVYMLDSLVPDAAGPTELPAAPTADDLLHEQQDRTYGLIFLFKHRGGAGEAAAEAAMREQAGGGADARKPMQFHECVEEAEERAALQQATAASMGDSSAPAPVVVPEPLYFAQQVVRDACATQALLGVLLNAPLSDGLGPKLGPFKAFTEHFDFEMKGLAIGNSEEIREAHNSFARPEPFVHDDDEASARRNRNRKKADAFHFIAYVPFHGTVYELDGLRPGPVKVGSYTPDAPGSSSRGNRDTWLHAVKPVIEARIATYNNPPPAPAGQDQGAAAAASEARTEFSFNLLRVTRAMSSIVRDCMDRDQEALRTAEGAAGAVLGERLAHCQSMLQDLEATRRMQQAENVRRRHNYIPFIVALLRAVSEAKAKQDATPAAVPPPPAP